MAIYDMLKKKKKTESHNKSKDPDKDDIRLSTLGNREKNEENLESEERKKGL